jgi:photosystem II stability/assembly factor-like uncharacterized protein
MNKIVFILFLVTLTPFNYSQWFAQNTGTQGTYSTLFFIDSLYGWIGGYNNNYNFILRTTDGGDSWNAAPINGIVKSIFFTNRDTGFCGTWYNSALRRHYIFKTTDGGINWSTVYTDSLPFLSITFLDNNYGYAVASQFWEGSIFVKTTNGGNSWTRKRFPTGYVFNSIKMLNESTGYIAGGFPEKVWETTTGGEEWSLIFEKDSSYEYFNSITFSNQLNGFACGSSFYKTTDSGNNWSEIILPTVTFVSIVSIGDKCWLAIDGMFGKSILHSSDLGVSWIQTHYSPIYYISDIFFVNENIGWACGVGSLLIKTNNGGVGNISIPGIPELIFPENGSSYIPIPVEFYWNEINNSFFRLQISFDESFNNICVDTLLIENRIYATLEEYTSYYWRVRGENILGNSDWSETRTFSTGQTVGVDNDIFVNNFKLYQNYPNPFNPNTQIEYSVAEYGLVIIKVYDMLGGEVITLVNEKKPSGKYNVEFDGKNLPSGIYFYRMQAGKFSDTKKFILLR